MGVGFVGTGGQVAGAASLTPTIHANQKIGDMMICMAAGKPFDLGWSMPAGWTSMGRGQSGTTAAGIDVGSMVIECWYKEATADPETDPVLTETTPVWDIVMAMINVYDKGAGGTGAGEMWITPTIVFGADEVTGTSVSATMSADNSVAANDRVMSIVAANTDALGPFTTDVAPTQTGVSFATLAVRHDGETTSGGDMAFHQTENLVTAGPSTAAASLAATGTASGGADRCELAYVRLRAMPIPRVMPDLPFIQGINHYSPI